MTLQSVYGVFVYLIVSILFMNWVFQGSSPFREIYREPTLEKERRRNTRPKKAKTAVGAAAALEKR